MRIEINNQQQHPLNEDAVERCARWMMDRVQALDPARNWTHLSLICTDDGIQELNRTLFGRDRVTDVISFAYPPDVFDRGDNGEVIVNIQQAVEEGQLRDGPERELALYIAHGCHHLMGAEDDTPERKAEMLRLEQAWVDEAASLGLLPSLLTP